MPNILKNVAGQVTAENTLATSAGAGSAGRVPELNGSGVLDATIVNSKNTSAGVSDAGKLPALNASGILDDSITNASATSAANKLAKLDGTGKLDVAMMPTGVGPDTKSIQASETLAAGDFVNVHNVGGARIRKADATNGRIAHGFVLSAVTSGANGTVYLEGTNTAVSGKTPGATQFLATTAGTSTETAPSTAGQTIQILGVALSATEISFEPQPSILLS